MFNEILKKSTHVNKINVYVRCSLLGPEYHMKHQKKASTEAYWI